MASYLGVFLLVVFVAGVLSAPTDLGAEEDSRDKREAEPHRGKFGFHKKFGGGFGVSYGGGFGHGFGGGHGFRPGKFGGGGASSSFSQSYSHSFSSPFGSYSSSGSFASAGAHK